MATLELDPLDALRAYPRVLAQLRAAGGDSFADEDEDARANRLGTRLMALWRDERSKESFEALYRVSHVAVRQWIQGLLGSNPRGLDPREVLQDTFVNVFRYPNSFRDDHAGSFRVWVRTIAGNQIRRACRPPALAAGAYPEGWNEPADRHAGPVESLVGMDERLRMGSAWRLFLMHYARAFEELAERDRRALQLVEVESLPYAEAGVILGVGRSNMKMIVFRARQRLARHMRVSMLGEGIGAAA
ncbi:MAG: sigma-70 family RNA polymerase sigma factor [Planctomycetota bacterium]